MADNGIGYEATLGVNYSPGVFPGLKELSPKERLLLYQQASDERIGRFKESEGYNGGNFQQNG